MSTINCDDLLVKSQLLISKFRKQREASLKMREFDKNVFSNCSSKIVFPITSNNIFDRILPDCDSYPQKDCNNRLLKKFGRQYYPNSHVNIQKIQHLTNNTADDITNVGNLSDSENSIWSNLTDFHCAEASVKDRVEKKDRGIMTDLSEKINIDEEDIFTPVTALPLTVRSFSDHNKHVKSKENKLLRSNENTSKVYTSICTSHELETSNLQLLNENEDSVKAKSITEDIILKEIGEYNDEEDSKMKVAMELFRKEKELENSILNQTDVLEKLKLEMIEFSTKLNNQEEYLNRLKNLKDEIKNKRFEIVNGLSNDLQSQINIEKQSNNGQSITNRSLKSSNMHLNLAECLQNSASPFDDRNTNDSSITLDNETVRNIVDKILFNELSTSDDDIFEKKININSRNENTVNGHATNSDECILSDVMSIKDFKITQKCNDKEDNKKFHGRHPNSINSNGFPPKNPKSKCRKFRAAHSMDNLVHHSSRPSSRRRLQSPAVSDKTHHWAYYKSCSSDSTTS